MVNLSQLNDYQKALLAQISYLDFTRISMVYVNNFGKLLCELRDGLEKPNDWLYGNAAISGERSIRVASKFVGKDLVLTDRELFNKMISANLGQIEIIKIVSNNKTGFQALVFKDQYNNIGISFRGSDFNYKKGAIQDWIVADIGEYFTNGSPQVKDALTFYSKFANTAPTYLYGHSLGGNLVSHVYLKHHRSIAEAFVINGNPVNPKLIDSPARIAAFNDPRFNCNIISGDIVGHLKSTSLYHDNIKYVANIKGLKGTLVSSHLIESAEFDVDGNFKRDTEEQMLQIMGKKRHDIVEFTQRVRNKINEMESHTPNKTKKSMVVYKRFQDMLSRILKIKLNLKRN